MGDNATTTAFFNFTDEFLEAETYTDMTNKLPAYSLPQPSRTCITLHPMIASC